MTIFNITKETSIEELELSVRQFNNLKKAGYSTINDIINASVGDLIKIRNMGVRDLTAILLRLDKYGFRCQDCSNKDYPVLADSVDAIIGSAARAETGRRPRAWNYGKKKPLDKFNPDGVIFPYTEMMIPNIRPSENRYYIYSLEEYHIKKYGIHPGAIVIFDRTLPLVPGTLSCFQNGEGLVCFSDHQKEENLKYIGRMIAVVNYFPVE